MQRRRCEFLEHGPSADVIGSGFERGRRMWSPSVTPYSGCWGFTRSSLSSQRCGDARVNSPNQELGHSHPLSLIGEGEGPVYGTVKISVVYCSDKLMALWRGGGGSMLGGLLEDWAVDFALH